MPTATGIMKFRHIWRKNGVKAFAVATIEEGIRLRRYGIRGMILILGYTDIHRAKKLKQYAHLKQLWVAELS